MSGVFKRLAALPGCWYSCGFTDKKTKALALSCFPLLELENSQSFLWGEGSPWLGIGEFPVLSDPKLQLGTAASAAALLLVLGRPG